MIIIFCEVLLNPRFPDKEKVLASKGGISKRRDYEMPIAST
jgi:hypothetical protein